MNYVSTNLRFPKEEYEDLRNFAFLQKRSVASLIREAVKEYRKKRFTSNLRGRMKLYNLIVKSRIKIDIPTTKLIKVGRKFE